MKEIQDILSDILAENQARIGREVLVCILEECSSAITERCHTLINAKSEDSKENLHEIIRKATDDVIKEFETRVFNSI